MLVSPQGAVLSFIQAGEAAVQAGDLTVGDWRRDTGGEEFTTGSSESKKKNKSHFI